MIPIKSASRSVMVNVLYDRKSWENSSRVTTTNTMRLPLSNAALNILTFRPPINALTRKDRIPIIRKCSILSLPGTLCTNGKSIGPKPRLAARITRMTKTTNVIRRIVRILMFMLPAFVNDNSSVLDDDNTGKINCSQESIPSLMAPTQNVVTIIMKNRRLIVFTSSRIGSFTRLHWDNTMNAIGRIEIGCRASGSMAFLQSAE